MSDIFRFRDAAREAVAQARKGLRYDARSGRFLDERGDPAGNGSAVLAMAVRESPAELARQLFEASSLDRAAVNGLVERGVLPASSTGELEKIGSAAARGAFRNAGDLQGAFDELARIGLAVAKL